MSTPIRDVVQPYGERGLVTVAANITDFVAAVERLLGERDDARQRAADAWLAGMSWDETWRRMKTSHAGRHADTTAEAA